MEYPRLLQDFQQRISQGFSKQNHQVHVLNGKLLRLAKVANKLKISLKSIG